MYNDLLSFLESWGDTFLCDTSSPAAANDDYSDYLSIGEKIVSLRKNEVKLFEFNKNSVYEVGYSGMYTAPKLHNYFCERLAKKLVRPCLPHRIDDLMNLILPEYQPSITSLDNPNCTKGVFKDSTHSVMVTIENDGTKLSAYTSLDDKLSPAYHWGRLKRSGELIVDPGFYFAELIILSEIKKELQKIKSLAEEEREENIFYASLVNECKALTRTTLVPVKSISGKYTDKVTSSILSLGGICTETFDNLITARKYEMDNSNHRYLSVYSNLLFYMVSYFDIPIFLLQTENSTPYFNVLKNLFQNLVKEYQSEKNTAKYNKSITSDYASAYQTKKNIPKSVLHAMANSKFNEHFGYVEFDEDCDLEKISIIEKEFLALTKIFNQDRLNEYSIRFRKLGKHRAAGLYFPSLGCLCVDIDSPNSLGHEYFHLLDYKNNCLSKRYSFQPIIQHYTRLIEEEVRKSDKLLKQWNGNTKYNRDYYLEPTEIFARCGEMYLTHIKQVSNSLVNPDYNGFAYPNNAELLNLIDNYFSKVLPEISNKKEVA